MTTYFAVIAELALVAIPIALSWLVNALWLGRRQMVMAEDEKLGEPVHNA